MKPISSTVRNIACAIKIGQEFAAITFPDTFIIFFSPESATKKSHRINRRKISAFKIIRRVVTNLYVAVAIFRMAERFHRPRHNRTRNSARQRYNCLFWDQLFIEVISLTGKNRLRVLNVCSRYNHGWHLAQRGYAYQNLTLWSENQQR